MSWQVWSLRILGIFSLLGAIILISWAYGYQAEIPQPREELTKAGPEANGPAPAYIGPHWSQPLQGPLVDPPVTNAEPELQAAEKVEPPKPVTPPVRLPSELVLNAIFFGGNDHQSLAVFGSGGNTTIACSLGESVLGAEVVKIERGFVVVRFKDTEFQLVLDKVDRSP